MKRKPPKNDAQLDLFMPMFFDVAMRDAQDTMEIPFFSLSKRPRFEPLLYKNERRGIEVIVAGGKPIGIANIWDKDILIWCMSQVREAIDRGEEPNPTIYFYPYQLLKAIRRGHGKIDYEFLEKGCTRLHNTAIHTTIRTDEDTFREGFHWIKKYRTAKNNTTGETAGMWSITLDDWVYDIAHNTSLILTLDDDYFLLTGGLERWLYLVARKHGGYQDMGATMPMKALHYKSGSHREYKYFARDIRGIVKANDLPAYHLHLWRGKDGEEYINLQRRSKLSFDHPAYKTDLPRWVKKMTPDLSKYE